MLGCCSSPAKQEAEGTGEEPPPQSSEPSEPPLPVVKSFDVKLHSAELSRSFAKIGWMDPFAIVVLGDSQDGPELGRTPAAKHAHKKPVWDTELHLNTDQVPDSITIAVWDKNHFHRDVFCGSTTIPCAPDMGTLLEKSFMLTKKDKPTGQITCTISVQVEAPTQGAGVAVTKCGLGPELDGLAGWVQPHIGDDDMPAPCMSCISFKQGTGWAAQGCRAPGEAPAPEDEEAEEKKETGADVQAPAGSPTSTGSPGAPLVGKWKCVDTWGLDEFLKAQKRSFFERKMAGGAKWPDWEFKMSGDKIVFLNTTMIGLLTEEIVLDREYENVDGQKNAWAVLATWTPADASGGSLVQARTSKKGLGEVREERTVVGDKLDFKLTKDGTSWGRSFVRA